MVRIFVIDNGGQWTHREWRTLKYLDVDTEIVPNTVPFEALTKRHVDGIVLSGGAPRIGLSSELGNCAEYLNKGDFPILGICAGHHFMARHFGGMVKPAKLPEFGRVKLYVLKDDEEIFSKVPQRSIVWESHNDEVVTLPMNFELLAESENCKIQAMKHTQKPFYGIQFHPEVEHTEYGVQIFKNFINLCEK